MHVLIQYLVQSHVDRVWALVALVQAPVDLVPALVNLFQAHPPQGGLISVVGRQVVVGPGAGLVGAVWSVFVIGVRRKQVFYFHVGGRVGCIWAKGVIWLH